MSWGPMVRLLLSLLVIGWAQLAGAIHPPVSPPASAQRVPRGKEQSSYEVQAELDLLDRANQSRAEASLSPLKMDACLTLAARRHAVVMAAREQLSHQFPDEAALSDRLTADCTLRLDGMAENVAYGTDAAGVHDGLMHSPHHRENLLHAAYNVAGIGVVRRGSTLYVVEDFGHSLPAFSAQGAVDLIAKSVQGTRADSSLPRLEQKDGSAAQSEACTRPRQTLSACLPRHNPGRSATSCGTRPSNRRPCPRLRPRRSPIPTFTPSPWAPALPATRPTPVARTG